MIIRAAREADAPAMGVLMVTTYLASHRDQMPAHTWARRVEEWTPDVSAHGWARTLRAIAAGEGPHACIYVVVADDGELVGLAMGSLAEGDGLPQAGAIDALYVREHHQGKGLGRRLVQTVAADLAASGMTALQIGCLAANAPARRFYESIGGRLAGERLFDEEGVLLPEVVYEWADAALETLVAAGRARPSDMQG